MSGDRDLPITPCPGASDWWAATERMVTQIVQETEPPLLGDLARSWARLRSGRGPHTLHVLPALIANVLCGTGERAIAACACWVFVRLAAKLFDDFEDGDLTDRDGTATALYINGAVAMTYLAQVALARLAEAAVPPERVWRASRRLSETCVVACSGQHRDIRVSAGIEPLDPDAWHELALRKSGALFGWAAWVGALITNAPDEQCEACREYGVQLGILLQLGDDYDGIWVPERRSDLAAGSPNIAVAYARLTLDERERARFDADLEATRAGDSKAEQRAIGTLTDSGAQGYLLVAARVVRQRARRAAMGFFGGSARTRDLDHLLDSILPSIDPSETGQCPPNAL